jgi:hypothetical protein
MNGLAGERCEFSLNLSRLEIYANEKGYKLARDEGRVFRERKGNQGDVVSKFTDRVHSYNSLHYQGLAQDYCLYIDNEYIIGDHIAWWDLASFWKNLNPKCTWGGNFKTGSKGDFNHFSWGEGQ